MHVESIPWITKGCYFHLFHHLSFYNLRFLGQELALFIHLENLWNTESMWMEWRESICLSHKFHGNKFLQKCSICSKWLANVSENSGLQWCLCSFYELSPPLLLPQALFYIYHSWGLLRILHKNQNNIWAKKQSNTIMDRLTDFQTHKEHNFPRGAGGWKFESIPCF